MQQNIHYTLRVASAMCFIGHGAFGIITKPVWCHYFAVFGIDSHTAYQMMPLIGTMDILLGILLLIYPIRAVALWLVVWGIFTALLRPLSGEPVAEFFERAGNFGAPLVLLIMSGGSKNSRSLFARMNPPTELQPERPGVAIYCLRITVFLLMTGHGWLNMIGKKGLLDQYSSLGFSGVNHLAMGIGLAEILAAVLLLIHPYRQMVFLVFLWKMSSELFYPHYGLLEWIERGGSYGVLIALWFALEGNYRLKPSMA